jgi:hypothetical protein
VFGSQSFFNKTSKLNTTELHEGFAEIHKVFI